MKKIIFYLTSMKLTAVFLLLLAVSTAVATFIENDYGTPAARAVVYNALWFELLLIFTNLNLLASIFKYRLWKRDKWTILTFHVSFIFILLGAGLTRYFGFEGNMHIRENGSSSTLISQSLYLQAEVDKAGKKFTDEKQLLLSSLTWNHFTLNPGGNIKIKYKDFYDHAKESLKTDPDGKPGVVLVVSAQSSPDELSIFQGESYDAGPFVIDFESGQTFDKQIVKFRFDGGKFFFQAPVSVSWMRMADQVKGAFPPSAWNPLEGGKLHTFQGSNFVIRNTNASAVRSVVSADKKAPDSGLILTVTDGTVSRDVALTGSPNTLGKVRTVKIGEADVKLSYGSKLIDLPFSLFLSDFIVDRYPGSNSPSGYESRVKLTDQESDIHDEPKRIFMNNILVHRGYRFYQSSFDPDEKGTVLSVGKDPGMYPTYLGYFILTFGLLLNLFNSRTRLGRLTKKVSEKGNQV